MSKLLLRASASLAALFAASTAFADENGIPGTANVKCEPGAMSTIAVVCKAIQSVFPSVSCKTPPPTCSKVSQEVFTGLTTEAAQPGVLKNWNGQGGSGEVFQTVGLCLMRDLAFTKMEAPAEASLPIGSIKAKSVVAYREFDPKTRKFKGYHRLSAHAPVIGDIDILTQEFSAGPVNSNLKGAGKEVGKYAVLGSHAIDFNNVDTGTDGFGFEIDAIKITTPYGEISPKPHLDFGRSSRWSLSPYGGASTMLLNPGGFKTTDAYGRLKGQSVASAQQIFGFEPEPQFKFKPLKNCGVVIKDKKHCVVPAPSGWTSQMMLGARNVDPTVTPWGATPGDPFPARPDADVKTARGQTEKDPNGYAKAGIKIEYNPIGLLPAALLESGFIQPTLKVFADPNVEVLYASQFNFWNGQVGTWNPALTPPQGPAGTLLDVESLHSMALYAGASVAGRFAIDAGVDIVLRIFIPLPWPLDDIDFNIVDVHPRTAFLETVTSDTQPAPQGAFVMSDWQNAAKTGQLFKTYIPLGGAPVDGLKHLEKCLKEPAPPPQSIPPVSYTPGDPEDLVENLDLPCNICAGFPSFTYIDVKSEKPLVFEKKTVKGQAGKTAPFVDDSKLPAADRWTCGGALPSLPTIASSGPAFPKEVKTAADAKQYNEAAKAKAMKGMINVGCYDQCRVNKKTGKFELIMSAKKLYALGIIKDALNGCH